MSGNTDPWATEKAFLSFSSMWDILAECAVSLEAKRQKCTLPVSPNFGEQSWILPDLHSISSFLKIVACLIVAVQLKHSMSP